METKLGNILLFIVLSFIWGSSFILMKAGLLGLNAFQVASVRIIASGLVLVPMLYKSFKIIPTNKIPLVFLSGQPKMDFGIRKSVCASQTMAIFGLQMARHNFVQTKVGVWN
jgi:drug/metabolite transporter (DMT)-like permease